MIAHDCTKADRLPGGRVACLYMADFYQRGAEQFAWYLRQYGLCREPASGPGAACAA